MKKVFILLPFILLAACSKKMESTNTISDKDIQSLRNLTAEERSADFDQLIGLFKAYYGPYEYKERRFNYSLDKIARDLRAKAVLSKTDEEFAGYVMQLGAALHDGHVQISLANSPSNISRIRIPVVLTPVEGRALIVDVDEDLGKTFELDKGDEVLEVDGQPVMSYLPTITKYKAWGNPESDKHQIFRVLSRSSFMTDLLPKGHSVTLKLEKADGRVITRTIPWTVEKYNKDMDSLFQGFNFRVSGVDELNSVIPGHLMQMGATEPFFLNSRTIAKYGFVKVYPSSAAKKRFGLSEDKNPPIYAALYRHNGKTLLLVRQPGYSPSDYSYKDYLKAYRALLSEYENLADVLVIDQTHNPGGNGSYCSGFFDLISREGDVEGVQMCRADRKWINDLKSSAVTDVENNWEAKLVEAWVLDLESAYDKGQLLSSPIPIFTGYYTVADQEYRWQKPVLALIDELAGSCGDIFPMLTKANKRAVLFGKTTMGLGGNVEEVGILTNSQISVRLTRGLFAPYKADNRYESHDFVENNGVAPDIEYNHTLKDLRGGYTDYVGAFSDEAIKLVK